jgi:hypothetical protein
MAHEIQFNSTTIQEAVNFLLQLLETKLFVTVTVKQLMEGKSNISFLSLIKFDLNLLGYTDPLIETASIVKPGVLKDNKFGILQAVMNIITVLF